MTHVRFIDAYEGYGIKSVDCEIDAVPKIGDHVYLKKLGEVGPTSNWKVTKVVHMPEENRVDVTLYFS